jgi:protein gp37
MNNVSKTISWANFTINPVKGLCPMDCKNKQGKAYCYARRIYKRFHLDETIRFNHFELLEGLNQITKPSKVFIGSTMELFGEWVQPEWLEEIFSDIRQYPQHTFIFLSKQPYNLSKWEFPDNCWVGISTTGNDSRSGLEDNLKEVKAKTKFVSIEPLLDYSPMDFRWVDWVIIGRQTPLSERTKPRIEWIKDIVVRCDEERKPVFLKNNLSSLLSQETDRGKELLHVNLFYGDNFELRQEFPHV